MAQQTINVGTAPNDGTGTPLRTAFQYTNSNFSELYTAVGPSGNNIVVPGTATITGDLTVDTNTLKVDSANNYVGIGTASPVQSLTISGEASVRVNDLIYWNGYYNAGFKARATGYAAYIGEAASGDFVIANTASSAAGAGSSLSFLDRYRISNSGVHTWEYVGGVAGTAMTLNATGLGVGTSPTQKFVCAGPRSYFAGGGAVYGIGIGFNTTRTAADHVFFLGATDSATPDLVFSGASGAALMRLDASGNLLVGTTSGSYRGQFAVATGADRNIFAAQVTGASNGLQVQWNNGTQKLRVNFSDLPTSSAGLPVGTLWVDTAAGNTLKLA